MRQLTLVTVIACAALMFGPATHAQQAAPPPNGTPISLEVAKKIAAAAIAESKKNNWTEAIVICEPNGTLVYLERMDGVQYASVNVAIDKAISSALYRRPTTAFEGAIKAGNLYVMQLRGANAVPGGMPIVVDGKLVGGIGVSGGSGADDVHVAQAGLAALK
jgi:glc operon protein GlcG